ncbi:PREDICTED: ras-related and estrogen-regulated growth inhibitor-like [Branchiostoma belcheri]|uniref:small monomeric GTPase n=1 Tax=Branchiostoma belcheri TaxID=7741 RepID=A0A6P4ZMV2_BRABE|nr:PREDICTED: ras-related and estrogen-regulated growth inhibitor-like [Branchiostoma belcheri]
MGERSHHMIKRSGSGAKDVRKLNRARVVVLGHPGCGKTALCVRFLTRRYIGEYEPNKESTYTTDTVVDGETIHLEILDTARKHQNEKVSLDASIKWGDGFIIMYSVTDRESFSAVKRIKRLIDAAKETLGIPVIIVANKRDLDRSRTVRCAEGQELAGELSCPFFEISVADGYDSVASVFHRLIREVKCEFLKHLEAMEKRSKILNMRNVLFRRRRSKTQ